MANFSPNIGLELPVSMEHYDINVFNKNNMVIDSEINKLHLKNECQDDSLVTKESLNDHISDKNNPHNVTKAQVGLGNVDNTSDIDKPVSIEQEKEINSAVSIHNIDSTSHDDIRTLISGLIIRLNTLADSDDTTLDQLSEIVAYIKNNKSLIDSITTSKISVSDIVDNLISTDTSKVLSANQGRILKGLIDSLTKYDIGLGNVENKSSATIRGELTKDNITSALGYTPPTTDTTYNNATTSSNGLMTSDMVIKLNNVKTITFSTEEPTTVAKNEIVMVYETK